MQISIEPNSVYTFKLNSGEELIAKVVQAGGDFIIIEEPVSIAPTQQGMQMIPSIFTADPKGEFRLNTTNIAIYAVTDDFLGDFLTNPTVMDKFKNVKRGKVIIGKNVSIGSHCLILPNVLVGDSSSLGAMSLVNKNVKKGQVLLTKQEKFYGVKKNLKIINIKINKFKKLNSSI